MKMLLKDSMAPNERYRISERVPRAARRAALVLVWEPGLGLRAGHAESDVPALGVGHSGPSSFTQLVRFLYHRKALWTPHGALVREPFRTRRARHIGVDLQTNKQTHTYQVI